MVDLGLVCACFFALCFIVLYIDDGMLEMDIFADVGLFLVVVALLSWISVFIWELY